MLFETAWLYRDLGELEIQAGRTKVVEAWKQKLGAKAAKMVAPEVALTELPVRACPGNQGA